MCVCVCDVCVCVCARVCEHMCVCVWVYGPSPTKGAKSWCPGPIALVCSQLPPAAVYLHSLQRQVFVATTTAAAKPVPTEPRPPTLSPFRALLRKTPRKPSYCTYVYADCSCMSGRAKILGPSCSWMELHCSTAAVHLAGPGTGRPPGPHKNQWADCVHLCARVPGA